MMAPDGQSNDYYEMQYSTIILLTAQEKRALSNERLYDSFGLQPMFKVL